MLSKPDIFGIDDMAITVITIGVMYSYHVHDNDLPRISQINKEFQSLNIFYTLLMLSVLRLQLQIESYTMEYSTALESLHLFHNFLTSSIIKTLLDIPNKSANSFKFKGAVLKTACRKGR